MITFDMTMPKGWNLPSHTNQSSNVRDSQPSDITAQTPQYRNPIPPGYIPSSPPPSRVTWPFCPASSKSHRNNIQFIVALVIIAVVVTLIVALIVYPYFLMLIPMIIVEALRGIRRGTGMSQYIDNMGKRNSRRKRH